MNEAIATMMERYSCQSLEDYRNALREILQEIALLGLWRSKFFERAAFYGGTCLRILYGLDRYSEDMDFSLLEPGGFDLSRYGKALQVEMQSFGFEVRVEPRAKSRIQSALLKADTLKQLLVIETREEVVRQLPKGQVLKIRLEIETDPPPGFETESKFLLTPLPFSVRTCAVPDLFASKMHALLCRRWKTRVKGRDWYDFAWFVAHHPALHLAHLEQRMIQSGDWEKGRPLTPEALQAKLNETIDSVDLGQAAKEVEPFVPRPDALAVWSREFFHDIARRIKSV